MKLHRPTGRLHAATATVIVLIGAWAFASTGAQGATKDVPAAAVLTGFSNNSVPEGLISAEQSADLVSTAGADIDKVGISWKNLEPSPGDFRWAKYDAIYQADLARGVKPLFNFSFAPQWASGAICAGATGNCHAPPTPAYYDEYANAAAAVAKRYPEAVGIEIWNEPNHPGFWGSKPDPTAYAALLAASYQAIKAARPSMKVVAPAAAAGYGSKATGKIASWDFLGAVYQAGGKAFFDALSVHVYADPRDLSMVTALPNVTYARLIQQWFNDSSTPIWVTETGVTTTGPYAVSETTHATMLGLLEAGLRAIDGVEMVLVHTLIERDRADTDPETGYGVITKTLRKKPAYCRLAANWGRPCAS